MSQQRQTLISSVQRALRLMDIVANAARPLPVKAIANAAGLSLGTAYNLTRTLVHEGYLATEPDGLVLGSRFPSLRGVASAGVFLARVRQTLRQVAEEHCVTAHLSRFVNGEVHLVDIVDATGMPRAELRAAQADNAQATAVGQLILAQLSREQRADYLARHPPATLAPPAVSSRRALLNHRQQATDAAADRQDDVLGLCVAVPVRAPGVIAVLAVSLPGDRPGADLDALARRLRVSAGTLSFQLGAARHPQFSI
jgi:DNA-binding IclR family transcriptional regulator